MKRFFKDPTAEDGDFLLLTREERRAIYKASALMLVILAAEFYIITKYIW